MPAILRSPRSEVACLALLASVAALLSTGCVSVKPLAECQADLGDRVVEVGGQRVYVEQAGRGEPILMVHGFGSSSYSWREVMPELASRYRVAALDLSGFGWTERPDSLDSYTREGQVALIVGVMDALGLDNAHIVGHSYGGALTMALAAEHPERVRSMVLVSSAAISYPTDRRKWFAGVPSLSYAYVRGMALRPIFFRRLFRRAYYDDSLVTDDLIDSYLERLRVEGVARGFKGLTRPLPASPAEQEIRYEDLDIPALVVWGAEDRVAKPELGRAHAGLLPDHRFVTIEEAGHSPMEEQPDEFLRVVIEFLEARESDRNAQRSARTGTNEAPSPSTEKVSTEKVSGT